MTAIDRLVDADAVSRLIAADSSLFQQNGAVPPEVTDRMGWTRLAASGRLLLPRLRELADEARDQQVTDVVLLGMGGSSLASLVMSRIIGADSMRLHVVDTVSPTTITRLLDALEPANTLYVVASKSGGTIEPNALYAIFRAHAEEALGEQAGRHFIAVTDPGSSLEDLARTSGFRAVVQAPSDVGGRFSALTVFGLVPAALMGQDVSVLLERAATAEEACAASAEENPALELAAFMTECYEGGADKLTIVSSERLRSFGLWTEQLVAESLGKCGMGITPVVELSSSPTGYGPDRAVCVVRMTGDRNLALWAAAQRGRHPVYEIVLDDEYDVAEEFVRWEYAVALTGFLLGINPFDQPNVAEAKSATADVLSGNTTPPRPSQSIDGIDITYAGGLAPMDHGETELANSLGHAIAAASSGDYLALLAYLPDDETLLEPLTAAVPDVSAQQGLAVCFELGPRYLHSTGQLHKGGPDKGVFVLVTTKDPADIPVPGQPWTLRELHRAQAEGDLMTLAAHGRRVLRIDLPSADASSIRMLAEALLDAAGVVREVARVEEAQPTMREAT